MAEETIEAPEKAEVATQDNGQQAEPKTTKYADDGAEGLDNFLNEIATGEEYLEKVSEPATKKEAEPEAKKEEEAEPEKPLDKETQEKLDTILSKYEEEGELSVEEIEFMKEQGYNVEEETPEKPSDEAKKEDDKEEDDKEEEKPVEFTMPSEFTSELDDMFDDDESYDPKTITVEDRLKYATKALKTFRGNQSKIQQIFDEAPEVAAFISDLAKGVDPQKAMKNNMPELLSADKAPDPAKDKEAYDKWVIDQHEQKQERNRVRELQKTKDENFQKSIQEAQEFASEKKMTDEKSKQKFFGELDKHVVNMAKGHVSKEFMDLVYKGMNYKKDVESAERAGEVKGMNKKVKLTKRNGDGLARIRAAKKEEPSRGITYADENAKKLDEFLGVE